MISRVAIPHSVFLPRVLKTPFSVPTSTHEQRPLGFEIGVEDTLWEAGPSTAVRAGAVRAA